MVVRLVSIFIGVSEPSYGTRSVLPEVFHGLNFINMIIKFKQEALANQILDSLFSFCIYHKVCRHRDNHIFLKKGCLSNSMGQSFFSLLLMILNLLMRFSGIWLIPIWHELVIDPRSYLMGHHIRHWTTVQGEGSLGGMS